MYQFSIFTEPSRTGINRHQFMRAQDLMENLIGSHNLLEFQLVSLISKEFLRKALDCDDFQFNTIGRAALVYLSTLYFATSEYKTVIDLCSTALMDQPTGFLKVWKLRITILLKTLTLAFSLIAFSLTYIVKVVAK